MRHAWWWGLSHLVAYTSMLQLCSAWGPLDIHLPALWPLALLALTWQGADLDFARMSLMWQGDSWAFAFAALVAH
eukprot:3399294-Alexandrium_andersonii.AAC.1